MSVSLSVDLVIHSSVDGDGEATIHIMVDGDGEFILLTVDGIETLIYNIVFPKKKMSDIFFFY